MAFCAWCGNPVHEATYAACPRCGNPSNGAPPRPGAKSGSNAAMIVIGVVAGGLVLVAVLGIVAAIAIPNTLTAMQRSRQKRTMADMRSIATALESYATDNDRYPEATSVGDLAPVLAPKYIAIVPTLDGWGTPLRYEGTPREYAIASGGADKRLDKGALRDYTPGTATQHFDCDIVFANGSFVQYPEGVQKSGGQ